MPGSTFTDTGFQRYAHVLQSQGALPFSPEINQGLNQAFRGAQGNVNAPAVQSLLEEAVLGFRTNNIEGAIQFETPQGAGNGMDVRARVAANISEALLRSAPEPKFEALRVAAGNAVGQMNDSTNRAALQAALGSYDAATPADKPSKQQAVTDAARAALTDSGLEGKTQLKTLKEQFGLLDKKQQVEKTAGKYKEKEIGARTQGLKSEYKKLEQKRESITHKDFDHDVFRHMGELAAYMAALKDPNSTPEERAEKLNKAEASLQNVAAEMGDAEIASTTHNRVANGRDAGADVLRTGEFGVQLVAKAFTADEQQRLGNLITRIMQWWNKVEPKKDIHRTLEHVQAMDGHKFGGKQIMAYKNGKEHQMLLVTQEQFDKLSTDGNRITTLADVQKVLGGAPDITKGGANSVKGLVDIDQVGQIFKYEYQARTGVGVASGHKAVKPACLNEAASFTASTGATPPATSPGEGTTGDTLNADAMEEDAGNDPTTAAAAGTDPASGAGHGGGGGYASASPDSARTPPNAAVGPPYPSVGSVDTASALAGRTPEAESTVTVGGPG